MNNQRLIPDEDRKTYHNIKNQSQCKALDSIKVTKKRFSLPSGKETPDEK